MKTSSTRAGSAIAMVMGLILAFGGFALMLEAVGRDFDWRGADIGAHVVLIVIGVLLFLSGSMPAFVGNSSEDLARPSSNDEYSNSDFGGDGD